MTTLKVLFAVPVGEPDWCEVLITEYADRIPDAKKWAQDNGYDRLRIASVLMKDGYEMQSEFAATVNV